MATISDTAMSNNMAKKKKNEMFTSARSGAGSSMQDKYSNVTIHIGARAMAHACRPYVIAWLHMCACGVCSSAM